MLAAQTPSRVAGVVFFACNMDPSGVKAFCVLYTSDAADERSSVDLGGRRIIKKKTTTCSVTLVEDTH